jgi:hypothetical protein
MRVALHRLLALFAIAYCMNVLASAQWTAAAYIGAAHTQNTFLDLRQPLLGTDIRFHNIAYQGESFQPPLYYGLRTGYWFRRHWGVEAELTHLKVFARVEQTARVTGTLNGFAIDSQVPINSIVQRFSISHGVNLLLANVVFHHGIGRSREPAHPRAYAVLRFGAGTTIPHAESTIQNVVDEHYQVGGPAFQVAASVEARLWERLYWTGEYKFTRSREQVDVNSGTATTLLVSHHLATGPVIHF